MPTEVVNQIAAGEVVERPSHLVKELVENGLDAGATEVEVEFSFGGKRVRVHDNGCGISQKNLHLALARHATSKIRHFQDIWSLGSYGFRGEALASIAAVSKVRLVSKTAEQKFAYQLNSDFGKLEEPSALGGETGTTIAVSDLFTNVPARLKFLKSDAAESTQIKNVLKAMAMAYHNVSFRIRQNGKLLFYWPTCEDRKSRVEQVLEQETMYVGSGRSGGIRAEAVLSSPNNTVGTRRQICMFAQNRWVQDSGIQAAIMDAYRSLLMHGEYPIVAVWVSCAPDEIDVNIHPTKSQVKFRQASDSFKAVSRAVRGCLERAPWVEDLIPGTSQKSENHVDLQQEFTEKWDRPEFHRTQFPQKSFDWKTSSQTNSVGETLKSYTPAQKNIEPFRSGSDPSQNLDLQAGDSPSQRLDLQAGDSPSQGSNLQVGDDLSQGSYKSGTVLRKVQTYKPGTVLRKVQTYKLGTVLRKVQTYKSGTVLRKVQTYKSGTVFRKVQTYKSGTIFHKIWRNRL